MFWSRSRQCEVRTCLFCRMTNSRYQRSLQHMAGERVIRGAVQEPCACKFCASLVNPPWRRNVVRIQE